MAKSYKGYSGYNTGTEASVAAGARKYKNQVVHSEDGTRFASKRELHRYHDLVKRQMLGEIEGLELQPRFRLDVNGVHICDYLADFRYKENGVVIVEDVKGLRTPVYLLKRKLLLAVFGITILET